MATLHLDDALYRKLQASAQAHGRSPEDEARRILSQHVPPEPDDAVAALRAVRERIRAECGVLPDSVPVLREMRDGE